jgi:small subunit ribosomal protein S20
MAGKPEIALDKERLGRHHNWPEFKNVDASSLFSGVAHVPNIESAKKRLRQSLQRRARNRAAKSSLKTSIKKLHTAVAAKEFDTARAQFSSLCKLIDQTASKGIIHTNKASRTKSRLSRFLRKASAV